MRCHSLRAVPFAVALSTVACGGPDEGGPRAVVLVKGEPAQARQVSETATDEFDAQLLRVMPQSGTQAWSVPRGRLAAFERQLREDGVSYVEPLPAAGAPVIADRSVQSQTWSPEQRRIIESFTEGLAPGSFRVSEQRPPDTTFELFSGLGDTGTLAIVLPDNTGLTLRRTSSEASDTGSLRWYGQPLDGPGEATFVIDERGVTGTLRLSRGTFTLLPLPGGRQLILQSDRRRVPREHPPDAPSGARMRPSARAAEPPTPVCAGETSLDVLVVHTQEAAHALPAVSSLADLAFVETQKTFQKSTIPTTLRLRGPIQQVAVPEDPTSFTTTLARLVASPEVATLRDARAADVVMMVVSGKTDAGLAEKILATPATAFAIVSMHWMTDPEFNFGHEIGHLFGARHDPATDSDPTPFPDGHGYVDALGEWRTIMAYDTCACPRIGYWASPNIAYTHNGHARPTGNVSPSHDARVIRAMTGRLSQFRCSTNRE